jgi:hypothetical protein
VHNLCIAYTVNIENLGIGDAKVSNQYTAQQGRWNPCLQQNIGASGGKDSGMVQAYSGPIDASFDITLIDVKFECHIYFEAGVSSPTFSSQTTGTNPRGYILKHETPYYQGSAALVALKIVDP